MSHLNNYIYGWHNLEPIIIACLARGNNFLLLGSHGCGKSSVARFVSAALSGNDPNYRFIKYEMSKENLLSMVGCPNPEDIKKGKITYATHERSVCNADVIMMDEITRAPRETGNMVLEILEERTVFGIPLKYKFVIATANEETYKGAYKLDAALLDRFFAVIPVPSTHNKSNIVGVEEISKMIELNQGKRDENIAENNTKLFDTVNKVRETYDEIWNNKKLMTNINDFTAKFFSTLLANVKEFNKTAGSNKIEISFRQISNQFVPLLVSVAAYYKHVMQDTEYLESGAWDAIQYSIASKLGFNSDKTRPLFETLKDLLIDGDSLMARISISVNTGSVGDRIKSVSKYLKPIKERFDYADRVNMLGNIINEINDEKEEEVKDLVELHKAIKSADLCRQAEYAAKLRLFEYAKNEEANLAPLSF